MSQQVSDPTSPEFGRLKILESEVKDARGALARQEERLKKAERGRWVTLVGLLVTILGLLATWSSARGHSQEQILANLKRLTEIARTVVELQARDQQVGGADMSLRETIGTFMAEQQILAIDSDRRAAKFYWPFRLSSAEYLILGKELSRLRRFDRGDVWFDLAERSSSGDRELSFVRSNWAEVYCGPDRHDPQRGCAKFVEARKGLSEEDIEPLRQIVDGMTRCGCPPP